MHRLFFALALIPHAPDRSAQTPPAEPSRTHVVLEAVHRSGAVPRCWNAFLQHQPDAPTVRFRLRVEVDANGVVTEATVLDPTPLLLANCIRAQVRHATIPAGPAITVETTYNFGAGTPAPIPGQ